MATNSDGLEVSNNPWASVVTPDELQLYRWYTSPEGGSKAPEVARELVVEANKNP